MAQNHQLYLLPHNYVAPTVDQESEEINPNDSGIHLEADSPQPSSTSRKRKPGT